MIQTNVSLAFLHTAVKKIRNLIYYYLSNAVWQIIDACG